MCLTWYFNRLKDSQGLTGARFLSQLLRREDVFWKKWTQSLPIKKYWLQLFVFPCPLSSRQAGWAWAACSPTEREQLAPQRRGEESRAGPDRPCLLPFALGVLYQWRFRSITRTSEEVMRLNWSVSGPRAVISSLYSLCWLPFGENEQESVSNLPQRAESVIQSCPPVFLIAQCFPSEACTLIFIPKQSFARPLKNSWFANSIQQNCKRGLCCPVNFLFCVSNPPSRKGG